MDNESDDTSAKTFEEVTPAIQVTIHTVRHFDTRDEDEAVKAGQVWAQMVTQHLANTQFGGQYKVEVSLIRKTP